MLRRMTIALFVLAVAGSVHAATNRPDGYETICKIGETCSVSAATNVAFGAAGQFVFKVLNGSFVCSVATFGSDPIPEKSVKECSVPSGGTAPPPPPTAGGITLSATPGNAQAVLNWSYSNVTAATQEVYRDTDSNPTGRVRIASVSSSTRSYTNTGLTNGTTYWYWIKNTNAGVVTNSNAVSATPSGGSNPPTNPPTGTISGSSCSTSGQQVTVNETIRVTSGVYDGGCRRFTAGSGLGDGGQSEGQDPIFRVENGATLRNVVIGTNGADGIHVYNGGNIDNVYWMNVGEDALTIKSSGTVNVSNIEGYDAEDKFFQINAASTLNVSNCIIHRAGKALRQNGGTTFRIQVSFDRCDINTMKEGVFRTDSSSSTARLTNSRLHAAGTVCIGPWSSCTQSGNSSY